MTLPPDPLEFLGDDVLYEGELSRIISRKYKDRNGVERHWAVNIEETYGPSGAVLAVTDDHRVILERSYRIPTKSYVIELPGGRADIRGEDAQAIAIRELLEETGHSLSSVAKLGTVCLAPGMSNATCAIFFGTGARKIKEAELGASEIIETLLVPLDGIAQYLEEFDGEVEGLVWAALGMMRAEGIMGK